MTDSSRRLRAHSTCKFVNFISAAFTQLLGKLMHPPDNDDVINAKSQIPLVGQENQENLCLWKVLCIIITSMTGIGIGIGICNRIGIGIAIAIGIGDGIGVGIGILIVLSNCRHLIVSDI